MCLECSEGNSCKSELSALLPLKQTCGYSYGLLYTCEKREGRREGWSVREEGGKKRGREEEGRDGV